MEKETFYVDLIACKIAMCVTDFIKISEREKLLLRKRKKRNKPAGNNFSGFLAQILLWLHYDCDKTTKLIPFLSNRF